MDTKEENKDSKSPAAAEGSSPNATSTAAANSSGSSNSFPNASMMGGGMNPMAMMQYQGMGMGGGGTQDMMSMMGAGYCGPTGAFGGMNPQLMAQMMGGATTATKRSHGDAVDGSEPSAKRAKEENDGSEKDGGDSKDKEAQDGGDDDEKDDVPAKVIPNIPASTEGVKFYSRNDVLCGRGGGTNVHPGNRRFRDLINANRRAYLKARKNDKPAISRSIVRTIREMNGRFLKKDEKQGLWFEIGDDGAREKTSQALRQRAPEMRKILFDDEQRQVAMQQQEMMMQRAAMMAASGQEGQMQMNPGMMMGMGMGGYGQMNPSMMAMGGGMQPGGGSASQGGGGGGGGQDSDLMAKYNQLHQKNWLAQEKNMILQRLAMSGGMNPQGGMNMPNMKDSNIPASQQQPSDIGRMSPRAA